MSYAPSARVTKCFFPKRIFGSTSPTIIPLVWMVHVRTCVCISLSRLIFSLAVRAQSAQGDITLTRLFSFSPYSEHSSHDDEGVQEVFSHQREALHFTPQASANCPQHKLSPRSRHRNAALSLSNRRAVRLWLGPVGMHSPVPASPPRTSAFARPSPPSSACHFPLNVVSLPFSCTS